MAAEGEEQAKTPRPSDEEVEARHKTELAAENEEHLRRTNTGVKEL